MSRIEITWKWCFSGALQIGTGLAKAGDADRLIRLENGQPFIPGDAVKGAIRGSAERLVRWLGAVLPEDDDSSTPKHPALIRLFASGGDGPWIRFEPASFVSGGKLMHVSQTAIYPDTGAARHASLRISESWSRGAEFEVKATGRGVALTPRSDEILLLAAAIVGVEQVGGRRGIGAGAVELRDLRVAGDPIQLDADSLKRLRAYLGLPQENRRPADAASLPATVLAELRAQIQQ
jgi:CRISPR/Cas system CSM-associated protein Csm3 (group 7 of RAMP superfamily)